MKKLTALLLALALVLSLSVSVFAGGGAEDGPTTLTVKSSEKTSQDVTVKVTVPTYYEWTVPSYITLTKKDGSNTEYSGGCNITFTEVVVPSSKAIRVTASSSTDFKLDSQYPYTLTVGGADAATGATASAKNDTIAVAASMTATVATETEVSDTVNFTASVE